MTETLFCYMMANVRCAAAASSALRQVLAGPARPAAWLGATRGALYVKTAGQPGTLVVLAHDAVRLPCGLVLPTTSAELPLTSLAPASLAPVSLAPAGPSDCVMVGDGAVRWTGRAGPVVVQAVREWAPTRPAQGEVAADALAAVRARLAGADSGSAHSGEPWEQLADLAFASRDEAASLETVLRLLGRGPGLTPSGDDVLAGFLVGAAAFGLGVAPLRDAIAALAPTRTTVLSAALLWHAARGECIDELAAVAAALTSLRRSDSVTAAGAVSRLLSVGHTSGAALALGLVTAAETAQQAHRTPRLAPRCRPVLAGTASTGAGLARMGLGG